MSQQIMEQPVLIAANPAATRWLSRWQAYLRSYLMIVRLP